MPAVSVVIPAYNRCRFLPATIESVLGQTFQDLEVIVVDDASTDGTVEALRERFGDRIRIERLPHNAGRSTARNVGWALSRGEFVAFLDSDDLWHPEKLRKQMPLFEERDVELVHCWVAKVDDRGQPLLEQSAELENAFVRDAVRGYSYGAITETWCHMYTSAVVLRRDVLRRCGGFDARLSNFEDWDVLWRVAREGSVGTVKEPLVFHRTHDGNTPTHWAQNAAPWLTVVRKHLGEIEGRALTPDLRLARRNLLVNMSLGEYWRRDLPASRRWMWRALRTDPGFLQRGYRIWGAPFLHACLPRAIAWRLAGRLGVEHYNTLSFAPVNPVTLVVDDGPTDITMDLLASLERAGHRGVLFVLGCNAVGREDILVNAVQRGFALGNHSYLHPRFSEIDLSRARTELEQTETILDRIYLRAGVSRPGRWFRFPYMDTGGEREDAFQELLRAMGFECPKSVTQRLPPAESQCVDWRTTVDTRDWALPPDHEIRAALQKARVGDVIEFHDKPDINGRYNALLLEELAALSLNATVPQGVHQQ